MNTPKKDALKLEQRVSDLLLMLGCDASLNGFEYARSAIIYLAFKQGPFSMMYDVYPVIAELYDTEVSRVERNIRHMIEMAWRKGRANDMNKYFGFKIYNKNTKPNNKSFLLLLADRVTLEFSF